MVMNGGFGVGACLCVRRCWLHLIGGVDQQRFSRTGGLKRFETVDGEVVFSN